jgi:hypothetical protein
MAGTVTGSQSIVPFRLGKLKILVYVLMLKQEQALHPGFVPRRPARIWHI